MHFRSFSRKRNINTLVTVTVTVTNINVKYEVYKNGIGEVVAHLNPQKNSPFSQICNVLHHHYVLSRSDLHLSHSYGVSSLLSIG